MNRSQRIVVSVVGIVIVGIALVGLTYGYFLARIVGNSSEKSITGKLQDLELTYDDQKSTINVTGIKPGDTVGTKTFAVKNNGKEKVDSYAVVLESVTNTLKRKDDLLFSLTCSSGCNGVEETVFPAEDTVIVTNSIDVGKTQTYTLTIKYKNFDNIDQSVDMGATFGAKVNIKDTQSVNPYTSGTLAYEIFNNALVATSETHAATEFSYAPKTKPAQETSGSDERTLSVAPDKYGNSYYFRGNIEDNYVTFGGMCWRVVRIQGDGSVKIILQDKSAKCSSTTKNDMDSIDSTTVGCRLDDIFSQLNSWYSSSKLSSYQNRIVNETWEIGDKTTRYNERIDLRGSIWYYEPYVRLNDSSSVDRYASLMPSTSQYNISKKNYYIGTLSADEVAFAGNSNYSYLSGMYPWWTLTPARSYYSDDDYNYYVYMGSLETDNTLLYVRPAIVLVPTVTATGAGTKTNPYVVSSE